MALRTRHKPQQTRKEGPLDYIDNIEFLIQPPKAAHRNGFFESLIKVIKKLHKQVLPPESSFSVNNLRAIGIACVQE